MLLNRSIQMATRMANTETKSKYFATARRTRSTSSVKPDPDLSFDSFEKEIVQVKDESDQHLLNVEPAAPQTPKRRKRRRIEVKIEEEEGEEELMPSKVKEEESNELPPSPIKAPKKAKPKRITTTKKSSSNGTENLPTEPPSHFWPMYNEIKKMRSKIVAPVDTVGCANISTTITGLTSGSIFRFQCLISLMLSSQTKDEVNYQVMKILHEHFLSKGFKDGLCLDGILSIEESELDTLIFKVGFHRRKAKFIKHTAEMLQSRHQGEIPKTIEEITAFPGVGPKMGFLLLQIAWNISTGIGVDTHMHRMADIYNWVPKTTKNFSPEYVRKCLESMLANYKEEWTEINPILVGFGQMICTPTAPRCDICSLAKTGLCPAVDKRLLRRIESDKQKGVSSPQKKSRGDLSQLLKDLE